MLLDKGDNRSETLDLKFNLRNFPRKELRTVDVITNNAPAFFFGALMFNFVIQLGQIVNEKELKLRDYMNIMGLKVSDEISKNSLNPYSHLFIGLLGGSLTLS